MPVAAKPVNPVIDFVLGAALLSMLGYFAWQTARDYGKNPQLAQLALGACFATVAGITTVRHVAGLVGRFLSQWRTSASIPEDCRDPLADSLAMKKWQDQAWQFAIHFSMSVWEIRLLLQHPGWWSDPRRNIGCPGTYEISFELEAFLVLQFVLWSFTGVSCKWFEERRKDYAEMMVHHVLTVGLILTAQLHGETAFGLVVLAVHDTSDVFLDLMKMANYLKVEGTHGLFVTELCFVLNTYVGWPYLRLYVFPLVIIPGQFLGYQEQGCDAGAVAGQTSTWDVTRVPFWITARTFCLGLLFVLHIFWWYILNRIGFKLVMGQSGHTAGDEEYEISMKAKKMGAKGKSA